MYVLRSARLTTRGGSLWRMSIGVPENRRSASVLIPQPSRAATRSLGIVGINDWSRIWWWRTQPVTSFRDSVMSDPPQTDVSRPSALPTATLHQRNAVTALVDQNSDEYLDNIEEEWNKKLDAEVEVLVDGMVDIVSLASVRSSTASVHGSDPDDVLDRRQGQVSHRPGIFSSGIACRVDGRPPSCTVPRLSIVYRYWPQVKAANSLLSITHSLKLLLLLSDEAQIAHRRDVELKHVQQEKIEAQKKAAALLDELFKRPCTSSSI